MSSTTIRNIAAQASVNTPVTISLSGLVKPDATVEVKAGDATVFKQNVTYMPPLDFVGIAIVQCDASDGNKVEITINVVPKPSNLQPEEIPRRIQIRSTTMAGDPVEDRYWTIDSDTGRIEGPAAAYVPLRIHKITGAAYEEGYEPEKTIAPWVGGYNETQYFAGITGSWIQLDLGQLCDISEVSITWKSQGNFILNISTDKKSFFKAYEGRGIGISRLILANVQGILLKIVSQSDIMEIYHIEVKGAPITPKPTQTGAQAILARSSQIVEPGQLVTMDGSQSKGDIIRYVWDSQGQVRLFNSDKAISSFVAPDVLLPTTLQFSLTIVDRNGQYSKAESLVYVKVDYPGPHWKDGINPGYSGIAIPPIDLTPEESKQAKKAFKDFHKERKKSDSS